MKKNVFLIIILLIFIVSGSIFSQNVQELRVGSFLSGYLNPGQEVSYRVSAGGLGILVVETKSELDTYLEVYDSQGNLLIENDDGDDLNAKIIILSGADKTFLYKLRGYDTNVSGPYRIYAEIFPMTNHIALRANSSLSGYMEIDRSHLYKIQPDRDGVLTVTTSGDDVDTVMQAYDNNYNFIIENDDFDEIEINSKIDIFVKAGENYYFTVRGFSSEDTGYYHVSASLAAAPLLIFDSYLSGYLESYGKSWFCIQAERNGHLVVEISSSFDTLMEAYDEHFTLIAEDDDSGNDLNALIEINARAGMTYYFLVTGYSGEDTGSFRITARNK